MAPMFPYPRRVVTGHDEQGNAIFVDDKPIPTVPTSFDCDFAELYETHEFPANLDEWKDPILERTKSLANENGVLLKVVDFRPNTKIQFHRTLSLDFGIMFEGEITCYLDNGAELTLKKGDVCVQRGTIHGWENKSDKPARVYVFSTASKPVNVGGKLLTATGFDDEEAGTGGK